VTFYQYGNINCLKFQSLEDQGIYHAVFTRKGGFSPSPWQSLNFGASVGDEIENVNRNRATALSALGIKKESVYDLFQVHSSNVVITNKPYRRGEEHIKGDGILTDQANITLLMRFADCVPVLLFDPVNRVVGIVHAGWMGTVKQIVRKAITMMAKSFLSKPGDIIATIGPSIGPDHYSVGIEVIEKLSESFGKNSTQFLAQRNEKIYLDLWSANQYLLLDAGVNNIEVVKFCTCCNLDDWYSHRGEGGKTGRFGVIIGIS
jgi:YfiH family protein